MCSRCGARLGTDGVTAIVRSPATRRRARWTTSRPGRAARQRMDDLCDDQRARTLAARRNRHVLVTGGAGSGKTARRRLGEAGGRAWRARAVDLLQRGHSLGGMWSSGCRPNDGLVVGSFWTVARAFERDATTRGARRRRRRLVGHGRRRTTAALARSPTVRHGDRRRGPGLQPGLAGPTPRPVRAAGAGPRRVLMPDADGQGVFQRGSDPTGLDGDWTRCELPDNCRNTFGSLACCAGCSMVRRHADDEPGVIGVRWVEADSDNDAASPCARSSASFGRRAGTVVDPGRDGEQHNPRAPSQRSSGSCPGRTVSDDRIVCENVHGRKGREADNVVLVAIDPEVTDALLYVGISRRRVRAHRRRSSPTGRSARVALVVAPSLGHAVAKHP